MPLYWNEYTPQYVAVVAIQAAVEAERKPLSPAPPKPADPKCPKCKGTGRIKTGDGHAWTSCSCTEMAECPDGKCLKR
jgi:hypothetical protein